MIFGFSKPKRMTAREEAEIIGFVADKLSGKQVRSDELAAITRQPDEQMRDDFLRRLYLSLERKLLAEKRAAFPDQGAVRRTIMRQFHVERFLPCGFSVLFEPPTIQGFYLLRRLFEEIVSRTGWEATKVAAFIGAVASGTPLSHMQQLSEGGWREVYLTYEGTPPKERQTALTEMFSSLFERTYREMVKEFGESRARIWIEEAVQAIEDAFGTLEAISLLVEVLPSGILQEKRIRFASREQLADTVTRQMQELEQKNIALEEEARQLRAAVRELEEAKRQLEATTKAQEEFIQVVSHQFRTPLSAIRWQADALLELAKAHSDIPELQEGAKMVHERSTFLVGVLENIFDLLAIDSGSFTVHTTPGDFCAAVRQTCEGLQEEALRKEVVLRCDGVPADECKTLFDTQAVTRVLTILITNAIQFSDAGDDVSVAVRREEHSDRPAEFVVSVQDQGIGIRPEDRPEVFDKFFRARNAVAKVPDGTGASLYIAKHIVELHGGRMWAKSEGEQTGATFSFTMPQSG